MKRSLLIAFFTVLILAVVWKLVADRRAAEEAAARAWSPAAEGAWSFPEVEDPARIEVGLVDETLVLEREEDGWWLRIPLDDRADPGTMAELVDLFRTPPVIDRRRPLSDAQALGLGPDARRPVLRYLDAEGRRVLGVLVGSTTEQGSTRRTLTWVEPEGGQEIVRIALDLQAWVERDLDSFRDRTLVRVRPSEVVRVERRSAQEEWMLLRDEDGWLVVSGEQREEASSARAQELLQALTTVRASAFVPAEQDRAEIGLNEPTAELSLTLEDGGTITLLLGSALEDGEEASPRRWAFGRGDSAHAWAVSERMRDAMMRSTDWLVDAPEAEE